MFRFHLEIGNWELVGEIPLSLVGKLSNMSVCLAVWIDIIYTRNLNVLRQYKMSWSIIIFILEKSLLRHDHHHNPEISNKYLRFLVNEQFGYLSIIYSSILFISSFGISSYSTTHSSSNVLLGRTFRKISYIRSIGHCHPQPGMSNVVAFASNPNGFRNKMRKYVTESKSNDSNIRTDALTGFLS